MKIVYFDSTLRTRKGNRVPYWDTTYVDNVHNGELKWFHEGYGTMCLYKLHQVDDCNFIAENLHKFCRTADARWSTWVKFPELALI